MSAPSSRSIPTPERVFATLTAYESTAALRTAVELELFTAIGEGNRTPEAIAQRTGASVKGARVLSDFLAIQGFLTKDSGGYGLAPDAAMFLDKRSPAYLGGCVPFMVSETIRGPFERLTDAVRIGGTATGQGTMAPDHPVWREFARGMAALMAFPSEVMARKLGADSGTPWKVLDIAAGHGLFGISIARLNPNAEVVAQDWAAVLEIAREHAQAAGVAGRFHTLPGSAFDVEFGSGYDLVLVPNFLHHFDEATNETLMRKVCAALKPGGRAATLEFVPNEDRISPPTAASFSLMMLATTAQGDAYTYTQLERIMSNAGFSRSEMLGMEPTMERLVVSYK